MKKLKNLPDGQKFKFPKGRRVHKLNWKKKGKAEYSSIVSERTYTTDWNKEVVLIEF